LWRRLQRQAEERIAELNEHLSVIRYKIEFYAQIVAASA